nr:hypothetical protein [Tessaracoccus coleopterorum]
MGEMGEYVRGPSSTLEAPVVRRVREAFGGETTLPGSRRPTPHRFPLRPPPEAGGQRTEARSPAPRRRPRRPAATPVPRAEGAAGGRGSPSGRAPARAAPCADA